ncbi:unnamed protein product [Timema podura]|uniref:Cell adhesion molecule Dscam1 C-terminal domain-containing protein n=1 Tax=Timema podura TaxID=61482 RepID=A0ABN7NWV4_TIMPD|nr:unnamed protein product [Timema podura]
MKLSGKEGVRTIAPARELPDQNAESPITILMSNLNLVVPVASALLVIIIAVIVICIMRGKSNHHKERESSPGNKYFPWLPEWLDLNVVVPVGATVVVIIVGVIVICVAMSRRSRGPEQTRLRDDVVYNQSAGGNSTMDKRRPDLRDELGYIAPPNRKLPPVPGSNYNTCDRIKRGHTGSFRNHATWDPRHPRNMYEELTLHPPNGRRIPAHPGSDETMYHRAGKIFVSQTALRRGDVVHIYLSEITTSYTGSITALPSRRWLWCLTARDNIGRSYIAYDYTCMEDEICPYATFHLLGFREEMDPNKAMQFQTFPHQNGHERTHSGTMGPIGGSGVAGNGHVHQRSGSQSMPRANGRYSRVANQNGPTFSPGPEYDDPANCAPEEDQYGSQYGQYGAPYDHYGSRGSVSRRSVGQFSSDIKPVP